VVAASPNGGVSGIVNHVRLSFIEPVDPATFSTADIVSFTGPNGAITVTGVTPVLGSLNRVYDITFAPQTARGNYQMVIGPNLADNIGNLMDQDNDGSLGESTQDRYTATFSIGDQYIFNSTDTPKSVPALTTTRSNLTISDDVQIADLDVRINLTS